MFSNIEKNMEVGLAAIPPWLKELISSAMHCGFKIMFLVIKLNLKYITYQ